MTTGKSNLKLFVAPGQLRFSVSKVNVYMKIGLYFAFLSFYKFKIVLH